MIVLILIEPITLEDYLMLVLAFHKRVRESERVTES